MPTKDKSTSAKTEAPPAKFSGFADSRAKFFHDLAKHQDRDWFAAHKSEYVAGWEQPMKALLTEARDKLDKAYPDCEIGEPKIFRLHRDVRFSNDKSPYKTFIGGCLYVRMAGTKVTETPAVLYLQLGTETFCAAGHYMMDPPQLARYREAVLDDEKGAELAKLTAKLEKAGFELGAAETLKKVPRGVEPEHPRAELLKRKGLVVTLPALDPKSIVKRELLDQLVSGAKAAAPLVRWLTFNVAS